MPTRHALPASRPITRLCGTLVCLSLSLGALATDPTPAHGQGSPPAHLVIKSTTDAAEVDDLVAQFTKLNPDVDIRYSKISSTDLFNNIARNSQPGAAPDVAWSSAMDLQIKLANDGFAMEYQSKEINGIPGWARWKDRAYGVTAEPVVIVFNKRSLHKDLIPQDHAALLRLLTDNMSTFRGKIATYDPELSGTGLLFITQDVLVTPQTWKLAAAMGRAGVKLYTSSATMIDRVSTGELLLAYNVLGSYALERAKHDQNLGIVSPSDYTLLLSRVALIPTSAKQPALARRFVDFLLSRSGQALLARHSLGSVRDDMKSAISVSAGSESALRPIALSVDLLTYLDQAKRRRFLKDWKDALQGR